MNINSILRKIARKRPASPVSVHAVLRKIIPEQIMTAVLAATPDRREVLSCCSRVLGVTDQGLLEQVANRLGLPFTPAVSPIDLRRLPPSTHFKQLWSAACIPIMSDYGLTAVVCADPSSLALLPELRTLPPVLGLWSAIQSALEESERTLERHSQAAQVSREEAQRDIAEKVILRLFTLVKKHQRDSVTITIATDQLSYEFSVEGGKTARGTIAAPARLGLRTLLSRALGSGGLLQLPSLSGESIAVKEKNPDSFVLDWSPQILTSSPSNILSFPVPSSTVSAQSTPEQLEQKEGRAARILVVDDNATFVRVLERFFLRQEIEVLRAADGHEAIGCIDSNPGQVDAVVCDVHMPEMNGIELLQMVRMDVRHRDLPIIMLTSDNDVELKLKLLSEGADAFVTKNEDPRLLCVQVKRLIAKRTQSRRAA